MLVIANIFCRHLISLYAAVEGGRVGARRGKFKPFNMTNSVCTLKNFSVSGIYPLLPLQSLSSQYQKVKQVKKCMSFTLSFDLSLW